MSVYSDAERELAVITLCQRLDCDPPCEGDGGMETDILARYSKFPHSSGMIVRRLVKVKRMLF